MSDIVKLPYYGKGGWKQSSTDHWMDVMDPSKGEVIAQAPSCTAAEVEAVIEQAAQAFTTWSRTPVIKRVQVLFRFRELLLDHMDELTYIVARENGKVWEEARGDLLKVKEPLELACGAPTLMMGESLMDTSSGYDTVLYREPVGVFAGIAPFNFPGMIPMGWMVPLCVATGNTMIIKASSTTPMTSLRLLELLEEAGLPQGVVSVLTTGRDNAQLLLTDPRVKGVCFVGTTGAGLKIYSTAASHGKRVQALCEAKNHALVMDDAVLERTAKGIINSAFGCAGERCMALPVVVAQEGIADRLVERLVSLASQLKVGCAYDKTSQMGPVVTQKHKDSILGWIETGLKEGAKTGAGRPGNSGAGMRERLFHRPHHSGPCDREDDRRTAGNFWACTLRQTGKDFRGGRCSHQPQPLCQRRGDLHPERVLRQEFLPADRRRHGRCKRGNPCPRGDVSLLWPQAVLLRGSAYPG